MNMTKIEQFNTEKMEGTLPRIVSPAKKNIVDTELSNDTSPIEKEKGINDRKYDKNKKCN